MDVSERPLAEAVAVPAEPAGPPRWVLPLLWAVLALGLLTALYAASRRVAADNAYRDVVLLVDWHELNSLPETAPDSRLSDLRTRELPWRLLAELPGAYVCYGEETVGSLVESGVLRRAGILGAAPTYEVALPQYAGDVARGAQRHGYVTQSVAGGGLLVQFPALPELDLLLLPVCWRADVIGLIESRGFPLILRPSGAEFLGADGVAQTLGYAAGQPLLLFQGPQVLGYPRDIAAVAEQLRAQGQSFAWVEFDEQDGGGALARAMAPDRLLRLHSIPAEEMVNYNPAGAIDRYLRAARERSIRLLYLRPFIRGKVLGGAEAYAAQLERLNTGYFRDLRAALEAGGFRIAPLAAPPQAGPGAWVRFPIALAAGAGLLWLAALWFPGIPRRWWGVLVPLELLGALACTLGPLYAIIALKLAIVFPLLGLWLGWTLYMRRAGDRPAWHPLRLGWALAALAVASLFSALGGLLVHAGLWSDLAILKLAEFRGVNVALALPILLVAAYAWQGETLQAGFDRARGRLAPYWQRFLALWVSPIRYGDVAFILIALGALGIVMLRSGNDGPLGPLDMEMLMRGALEDTFSVRPRTKELLGHPLLVLFFLSLAWRNRGSVLFALAGLLGQVSILNTFCHLHTPLLLTAERVALGLLLGAASALLWGSAALACGWLWERLRGRGGAG